MKDKDKTKEQLIRELEELRQQITKLKSSETKQGRIEELLRESERKFRVVFENAGGAIFIINVATEEITDCNKQAEKLIGRRRDDIIGMHYLKAHPENEAEKYKEKFNKYVKRGHYVDFEGEVQHMNGRRIPILLGAQTVKIGGKNMIAGILIDISEKKRIEEELRKTKDHLENIIESSLDSIVVTDNSGYITRVNKAFLQLLGHREEDMMGKHMAEFSPSKEGIYECTTGELVQINKEFFDVAQTSMSSLVEKGKILNAMGYHIRKDNKLVPVEDSIVSLYNKEGERIGVLGIVRDITERRKAENIITEGMKFLDRVIESSMDGIAIVDEKGHIISLNTALEKMCQFRKEELMGEHISILTIDDKDLRNSILEKTRELFEKGSARYETVNITKDGTYINVECNTSLIKDARGNIIAGVSIIRDITDRKNADKKIQETKDFLENIFKTSVDGIMVTDPQSVITMINESLEKMLGYSQDELLGKHTRELTPDEKEYEERTKEFVSTLSEEGIIRGFEHTWMRKDGSLVDIEINVALLKDDKGNIIGSVGSIRDITERKKAVEEIEKFQTIADRANYGVAISDLDGKLTYINEFFAVLHGYKAEEIIGKNLSIFHTEKQMKHVNELNEQLIHTGSYAAEEVWHKRKDNTVFPTLMSAAVIKDEKDNPLFLSSTAVDISEHKFAQKKIIEYQNQLRSLASQLTLTEEKERKHFAEYLHDQIGQILFSLKLKLETLRNTEFSDNTAEVLEDSLKTIEQLIRDTRSLTFDLSPPILYQLGLEAVLEWLTEQTSKQYRIMVTFEDDKQEKPMDDDIKIVLFQAVRELLINIAKHSQAQKAKVSIQKDNTHIRVCVKDDGVGFTPPDNYSSKDKNRGFGLFNIEERLDYLGGSFKMESTPSHGTRMTIVAPLKLQE